jgi:hypothetical protein
LIAEQRQTQTDLAKFTHPEITESYFAAEVRDRSS